MPLLRNAKTGELEFVGDSQVQQALDTGTHAMAKGRSLEVEAIGGRGAVESPDQLAALQRAGGEDVSLVPDAQAAEEESAAYEEGRYDSLGETGAAAAAGALDFLSLGGLSAIERATDPADELARSVRQHRGAHLAGQLVGAVATARPTGLAAATPAGAVMRGARALGTPGAGVGRAGSAAIKAGGMAAEGAGLGAGMGLAEAAISEDPFTIEHIVGSVKSHALLGGAGGAAVAAGGGLLAASWRQAKRFADAMGKRATVQATLPEELAGLDKAGLRARREAEVEMLEAAAVPERAALADEITAWREQQKAAKPWIAVEGFKGKKPGRIGKAKAPSYDQLGDKTVTRTVPLAEIEDRLIALPGEIGGRAENIRRGLAEGKKLPPVDLSVLPDGRLFVNDGRHRLRVYMEQGQKKVRARFVRGAEGGDAGTVPLKDDPLGAELVPEALDEAAADAAGAARETMRTAIRRERMTVKGEEIELEARVHDMGAPDHELIFNEATEFQPWLSPRRTTVRAVRVRPDGTRETIGDATFQHRDGGTLYPKGVQVDEAFQRGGLGARMYDMASKLTPKRKIVAADAAEQSAEGTAFSAAYRSRSAAGKKVSSAGDTEIAVPPELAREFREIGRVTLEADRMLDRLLRNPKRLARKPWLAEGALEQAEAAYERLQAVAPELRRRMAGDAGSSGAREAALDTVDDMLERNRQLLARVKSLTPEGALGGAWKPRSAMLDSIQAAEDALTSLPKSSLLQEAATGYAMGAMAGLAPGGPVGAAIAYTAPKLARRLADLVFGRMRRAAVTSGQKTERAVSRFLEGGKKVKPAALPTATAILNQGRLDSPTPPPARRRGQRDAKPENMRMTPLARAYRAREADLRAYVSLAPDGLLRVTPAGRQKIADALAGVAAAAPILADKLETQFVRRLEFLAGKLPRRPDIGMPLGPDRWQPATLEMRSLARYWEAADNPGGVEDRVADGTVSPEDAEAYRELYPERLADLTRQVVGRLPELRQTLPQRSQLSLSILTGVAVHPALEPDILRIIQRQHSMEEGTEGGTQAPQAQAQFGSVKAEQPTSVQQRLA